MKLGKLLAAGKSVINGRGDVSYRASKQVYLPKFGMAKNPFKTESPEPVTHAEAKGLEQPAVVSAPRATRAPSNEAPVAPAAFSASVSKKSVTWAEKFHPASIFRGISPKASSSNRVVVQRLSSQAMQAELKLDSVKVMHNDLSDVDVEIVPIKSRSGAADLPAPKKSWEFLGERLFGVEAT